VKRGRKVRGIEWRIAASFVGRADRGGSAVVKMKPGEEKGRGPWKRRKYSHAGQPEFFRPLAFYDFETGREKKGPQQRGGKDRTTAMHLFSYFIAPYFSAR